MCVMVHYYIYYAMPNAIAKELLLKSYSQIPSFRFAFPLSRANFPVLIFIEYLENQIDGLGVRRFAAADGLDFFAHAFSIGYGMVLELFLFGNVVS